VTSDDQAKLIKFNNVAFEGIDAGEVFTGGQNYTLTDGENTFVLRTMFWDEDYIGMEIPHGAVNITGVVTQFHDNMQITPRFAADIEAYSEPCSPPDWTPVSGLQYNMQVAAHLYLYDQISFNPNDILGAFVDGECRGVASPDTNQNGLVFLTIGSNSVSGETVELVIWDSENCEPCPTWQTLTFEHLQQVGTPSDPYIAECRGFMEFNTPMGQGFTWFSMNVDPGNMHLNTMLHSLTPCENDRVIGQTTYALYHNNQWMGSLQEIDPERMYIMELCSAQDLHVLGAPVASSPLSLGAGFTWLGYIPWDCLPLNTALTDLSPQPENNDRVIGQTSYALYHNGSWMGSLTQMCPGKGYVIDLSNASTLQYPESFRKASWATADESSTAHTMDHAPYMRHTMTVLGQLINTEGNISRNEKDIVYALWGDEKRGGATPMSENNGLLFMNIASDQYAGERITFVAWSDDLQQYVAIRETLTFESLQGVGNMESPFAFTMAKPLGNEITGLTHWAIGDAFPNPTYGTVNIPYLLSEPAKVHFRLYTGTGQLVHSMDLQQEIAGEHLLVLEKGKLPRGVYLYQVVLSNERNSVHKNGLLVVME
ncbi:MAG: T9SS C-terminal target domain-containing protein, partial [Bacteroidetes bacterium]